MSAKIIRFRAKTSPDKQGAAASGWRWLLSAFLTLLSFSVYTQIDDSVALAQQFGLTEASPLDSYFRFHGLLVAITACPVFIPAVLASGRKREGFAWMGFLMIGVITWLDYSMVYHHPCRFLHFTPSPCEPHRMLVAEPLTILSMT